MKATIANKMSYFILMFIFLIIIASFLFSGYEGFSMGSSKDVANVDGTPITTKEYRMALSRQVEFFNQMMGGSGMSEKQMEQMGIKESVLNSLIQLKLILNTADKMGFVVSLDEVKNEIRSMPYFKTNNQFDVNLYRNALQANGYIPAQFEELVRNDMKQKKVEELFSTSLLSENHVRDVMKFKNNVVVVQGVKVSRQSLAPLVTVSEQEIKEYVSNPANAKALEDAYTENASRYNKAEEVKDEPEPVETTVLDDTQTSDAGEVEQQPDTEQDTASTTSKPKKTVTIDMQRLEELLETLVFITKGWSLEKMLRLYTKLAKLADRYSKLWDRTDLVKVV